MVLAFKKISTTTFIINQKLSNMAMAQKTSISWQCDLSDNEQRLKYLFNTGQFSDIIIKCPGGNYFELHRMVLAMCSPVFEAMIFGPLATSKESLYLEDESEAIKYVFSYIYGCGFQCNDLHVVLEIFKIADKYILSDLRNKCTTVIKNLIEPENFKTIYEFTVKYDYTDLKSSCINFLQQDSNNTKATAMLMWLSTNYPSLFTVNTGISSVPVFYVNKLIFDSWRNPKSEEPLDEIVTLLESNYWQCNKLQEFAGLVPGYVIGLIPGPMRTSVKNCWDPSYAPVLKFSLNKNNAEEVIQALRKRFSRYGSEDIGLHIANEDISSIASKLLRLTFNSDDDDDIFTDIDSDNEIAIGEVSFYFSGITKENLHHINSIVEYIQPHSNRDHQFINSYMFPKCKLTEADFRVFGNYIFRDQHGLVPRSNCIWICSSYIEKKNEKAINNIVRYHNNLDSDCFPQINLVSNDNEIPGW